MPLLTHLHVLQHARSTIFLTMTFILIFTILALRFRIFGIKTSQLNEVLPYYNRVLTTCLGDSGGSDAPSPIGAAGSGGLGLALPGLGGGGLGSPGAPNLGGASTSI